MKKTISICLFGIFSLLCIGGIFQPWSAKEEDSEQRELAQQEAELVTEQETEHQAMESMSIQKAYSYYIFELDGWLAVYGKDGQTLLFETNIRFESLEKEVQQRVLEGVGFADESELYDFLESYSS